MMNKQSLVVGLLLERLADSKVGILVKAKQSDYHIKFSMQF